MKDEVKGLIWSDIKNRYDDPNADEKDKDRAFVDACKFFKELNIEEKNTIDKDKFEKQMAYNKAKDKETTDFETKKLAHEKKKLELDEKKFKDQMAYNKSKDMETATVEERKFEMEKKKLELDEKKFNTDMEYRKERDEAEAGKFDSEMEFKRDQAEINDENEQAKRDLEREKEAAEEKRHQEKLKLEKERLQKEIEAENKEIAGGLLKTAAFTGLMIAGLLIEKDGSITFNTVKTLFNKMKF